MHWRTEWSRLFGRTEPKIICVARNYVEHAEQEGAELPSQPILFAKFANTLCDHGDPIVLPDWIGHVDAEAELSVVIGRSAHNVSQDHALEAVAGYTCGNDISARELQFEDGQWFRGKALDTFCPIGPRIVPVETLGDAGDLRLVQRVNGAILQDSRTSKLIFGVPELVAFVSRVLTLEPGDLILTGTPEGVGYFRSPKLSLHPGDVVEVEIEGMGVLRNPIVASPSG